MRDVTVGEAVAGRGVRRSGAERGLELHRFAWRTARRHQGEEDQVRQGDPAEGDAASRRRQRLLRDQEGLLPRVRTHVHIAQAYYFLVSAVCSFFNYISIPAVSSSFLVFFLHFCKVKNQILSNRLCRLNAG